MRDRDRDRDRQLGPLPDVSSSVKLAPRKRSKSLARSSAASSTPPVIAVLADCYPCRSTDTNCRHHSSKLFMSYDPRLAAGQYGAPGDDNDGARKGGSVRAARERLQAAAQQRQPLDRSKIIGLPQRPNQLISQYSSQPQSRGQDLTPPESRSGSALSPQWPLPNNIPSPSRGPPPQRPPRPLSDELLIQQMSPGYRESFQSDEVFSPSSNPSRPLTTSSAASEASSLGSIPDFPVPQPPMPVVQPLPRRNPSLGPPPSSRRGPSSYYTQISYVSPIAEEAETRSNTIRSHHGSFASSNVMPYNEDFYLEDGGFRSEDEETITSDYERESRASDHDDSSGLVTPALLRQASLGRRTKPSLMTIKSADNFGDKKPSVKRKPAPGEADMTGAAGIGSAALAARDGLPSGDTGYLEPSSPEEMSTNSMRDLNSRFGDPEKDGFGMDAATGRGQKPRPPRLNMDAVREAEARGSLTSLPDLIRRATRLAANLDRGKTASRLSLNFWETGAPPKNNHRSGSMTDMLAAFPPPGAATPSGAITPTRNQKRASVWPATAGYDGTDSAMSDRREKRRRRCCGMPLWTFITLLIVLLFLVAAAVIIPVVLVVLPKMRNSANEAAQDNQGQGSPNNSGNGNGSGNTPSSAAPTATMAPPNGQCSGIITCQNGGVAILNADRSCNCVCINGFTGSTCATAGDAGCTTTSIAGTANNATLGSGIPRLIESAQNQFSIPLNSTRLLSIFSSLSLSCTAENALVTFNGLASRSDKQDYVLVETTLAPTRSLPLLDAPHPNLAARQAIGQPGTANAAGAAAPAATKSATSSAPTTVQPISSNSTALDFARLSVLIALQETGKLDTAANAQESIQNFLTENRAGNSRGNTVRVGPLTVDLVQLSIKFQNGTTVQATVKNPSS
ncbi:hypothetical protein CC80DRAFT_546278 [Byssothecium circinans]|uniref:EGF-like domain-containing protein n=1 Tax=Byssothecium circinans TaxID=147558 RepID=A0A6A5U529_9PLEO|nr:hypothetical protein CC80DRAFT_546278 [Byssothecium circinans]